MVIACAYAAPAPLDSPAEVISAPFTAPTFLSVQNSQIFLRNYKAVPASIVAPAALTYPGAFPVPTATVQNVITRLVPSAAYKTVPLGVATPLEAPVAVAPAAPEVTDNNDAETIAVTAPLTAEKTAAEPVAVAAPVEPAILAPQFLSPFKASVAAPFTLPVTKTALTSPLTAPLTAAVAAPLTAPVADPLTAPLTFPVAASLQAAPIVTSPYFVSPYYANYATLENLL